MAIVRPIIRPIVRAITQSITGAPSAIQRYFWDFTAAASQYGDFSSSIAPSGVFAIEVDLAAIGTPAQEALLQLGNFLVRVESDTQIRVWPDLNFTSADFTVSALGGALHSLRIEGSVSSSSVELFLDGVSQGVLAGGSTPDFTGSSVYSIGRWQGGFSDLVISNFKFFDAGTLIADFPLDTDLSNPVIANRAAGAPGAPATLTMQNMTTADATLYDQVADGWTGPELITSLSVSAGFTDNGDGTYTANTVSAISLTEQVNQTVTGEVYRGSFDITDISSGAFRLRVGGADGTDQNAVGAYTENLTATTVGSFNFRAIVNTIGTIRPNSYKRLLEVV